MGRLIIVAGLVLMIIGVILHFAPWLLNWIGKLPGDIRIETGRTRIMIPIVSMILLSIILTILLNIVRR